MVWLKKWSEQLKKEQFVMISSQFSYTHIIIPSFSLAQMYSLADCCQATERIVCEESWSLNKKEIFIVKFETDVTKNDSVHF